MTTQSDPTLARRLLAAMLEETKKVAPDGPVKTIIAKPLHDLRGHLEKTFGDVATQEEIDSLSPFLIAESEMVGGLAEMAHEAIQLLRRHGIEFTLPND